MENCLPGDYAQPGRHFWIGPLRCEEVAGAFDRQAVELLAEQIGEIASVERQQHVCPDGSRE